VSKTLEFVFDFASPNAYLAYKALTPVLEKTGATLDIQPCLLGGIFKATGNQAPMVAFGGVKGKLEYEQLEMQRFVALHSLDAFQFNPHFPVNTLILARGAIAAAADGELAKYVDVGLTAMWEAGLKMDDAEVYVATMNEGGLDGEGLLAKTQEPEIKAQLIANAERAVERGAFGIPTFFVGDDMFFGKDRLSQIEAALAS